jgi:hypothetical protein
MVPGGMATALVFIPLLLVMVYGGWLRTWHIDRQSLWLDEGISIIHAQAIFDHGYPLLPNRRISWDAAPVHYMMAVPLGCLADVHLAGRLLSLFAGIVAIPLVFWVARAMTMSSLLALLSALLVTFSMYEIAWSRQARLYPFLQCFMMAAIGCTYRFGDTRKVRYLVGGALFVILSVLTHRAGYLIALFLALYAIMNTPSSWLVATRWRDLLSKRFLLAAVLFGCVSAVMLLIPSHSNIAVVVTGLLSASNMNYAIHYGVFLFREMGIILPLGVLGMILASVFWPRKAIPLALSVAAYFLAISFMWQYFSFRYAFPLFAPFFIFAATPFAILFEKVWLHKPRLRVIGLGFCAIFFWVSIVSGKVTFTPIERYMLGYTEPQPEWKDAYDLIVNREKEARRLGVDSPGFVTVSALPLFHDVYIGPKIGKKYYLPLSFTGHPKDLAGVESYTAAYTVRSVDDLLGIKGYLILDDFGLRMLANKDIQKYLLNRTPNAVLKHEYNVFIWLLDGKR